jgi:S1-C subfamily serine protease
MTGKYRYAAIGLMTLAACMAGAFRDLLAQQDVVRREKKVAKEFNKAVKKADKADAKDIRIAIRPGSKIFPTGTGDKPSEFRLDGLRLGDLGVSFYNRGPGIVIEQIDPRSAFADYGFREQDRILAVGEDPVVDEREFVKHLFAESRRSGKIAVQVLHDDDRMEKILVEPAVLLEDVEPGQNDPFDRLGVALGDRGGNELRVSEVFPRTPAEVAGLRRGDVIIGFDSEAVKSADQLGDLISQAARGSYVVRVARDESERKLTVKLK